MFWLYIILFILAVIIIYVITIYNSLVTLHLNTEQNWSNINIILKQRNSEIPKLVETCKQYMSYEKETLENIIKARTQAISASHNHDIKSLNESESIIRKSLGKIFALAEQYPELKANTSFQHLQSRISSLEDSISDRREFFNSSINAYNIKINIFPDNVIAGILNYKKLDLLEFSDEETLDIDVNKTFQ